MVANTTPGGHARLLLGGALVLCGAALAALCAGPRHSTAPVAPLPFATPRDALRGHAPVMRGDAAAIPAAPGGAAPRRAVAEVQVRVLRVGVSPTARALFADAFERAFERDTPQTDVQVRTDTDRNCVDHLLVGTVDVVVIGAVLSPAEQQRGLTEQVLGHRIAVPIVHADNPLRDLRRPAVEGLITGEHRTWHAVGWENVPVQPVCVAAPGIVDAATEVLLVSGKALDSAILLRTEADVLALVANTPQAFGLVSLHALQGERHVKALAMDGVDATLPDWLRGAWRRGATFRAVAKPGHGELVAAWLAFLGGEEARRILQQHLTLPQ